MSVERIGVSSVEKIINQMGMIFREQPVDDYGIDAQIEIVENKPLARILYHNVDIGMEIPPELYQAVAEILARVLQPDLT